MSDKEFVDGLYVNPPHEKAPDFVKASIGIDRKRLGNWLRGREDDKIRIDVKEGKKGWYCEVNTWKKEDSKPSADRAAAAAAGDAKRDDFDDDQEIPF